MNWSEIWDSIKNFFVDNLWNIVWFFAALVIGIILVKILMNILRRICLKSKMEKIAQNFILAIVKFLLYLVLVLILLSIIGIQITGVLTAFSAVVLAVGMALQSNIANLANGIVIVTTHMFKEGDYIIVDGVEGSIQKINFLFITLNTPDNKRITIPNSTIVNSSVTNAGYNNKRRVDFTFSVAYESDVEQVKQIVIDVMKSDGRVYLDPAPFCRLKVLGASSIDFFANCWCDNGDYWDVYYYIIENVYNEFKRNNISIPFSQIEVRNRTDEVKMPYKKEPLPARVEKEREPERERFDLETADVKDLVKKKKSKQAKEEVTKTEEVVTEEVITENNKEGKKE